MLIIVFVLSHLLLCLHYGVRATATGSIYRDQFQTHITSRQSSSKLITWDADSFFIRNESMVMFSGEFHPFRLPVPGLWLDVFQKLKAAGFNCVSFYTSWNLYEGLQGRMVTSGIWDLTEFFNAATTAGIYLIARPGPYINAEVAAGGLPGWTLRDKGYLRTMNPQWLNQTRNYMAVMGKIIADAQIDNGGPVIMAQPENEYTTWPGMSDFPDATNKEYMAYVETQLRDAGVTVPLIVNDNMVLGLFAPNSGVGAVDIYGIDAYPLRWDCADPYTWPTDRFPTNWQQTHLNESPTTPFAISEFQGGANTGWGGASEDQCATMVNEQAVRVVYKNNYSFGAQLFNIYMMYGGTNWGNLGYHGTITSYDYGGAILEDRQFREKYYELKLEANFLKVSPAYLTATSEMVTTNMTSSPAISVTKLVGKQNNTNFYVLRHTDFTSTASTEYTLNLNSSLGLREVPTMANRQLVLNGRDSKMFVTDYDINGINMFYTTSDVYTWTKRPNGGRVIVLYHGPGEFHEAAFPISLANQSSVEGNGSVDVVQEENAWIIYWNATDDRAIVTLGSLEVHILPREEAYNYWAVELPMDSPIGNFSSPSKDLVLVRAGYLVRTAAIQGDELHITGDLNASTTIELISSPTEVNALFFNGQKLDITGNQTRLTGTITMPTLATIALPSFSRSDWKYINTLPELNDSYSDNLWTDASLNATNNSRALTTPTSLYAGDYGFDTGSLIYRGHFTATGSESNFSLTTNGGAGFAHSVWLNETFLGSFIGASGIQEENQTLNFPVNLQPNTENIITVLIDHMGQDESGPGTDGYKYPRGILGYTLASHNASDVTWKLTGNFGGENYTDLVRGPRNEGAMWAERQGFHLPGAPIDSWEIRSPTDDGLLEAGVGFFVTNFTLDVPSGWDIPMSIVFNGTANAVGGNYRVQFFINGWQFGKYVNNLGPQTDFPVPEGILNYSGENYLAVTLWALDAAGAKIGGFQLAPHMPLWSSYSKPALVESPGWTMRDGAY